MSRPNGHSLTDSSTIMIEYVKRAAEWDNPDTPSEEAMANITHMEDDEALALWDTEEGTETHVVSTVYTTRLEQR